MSSNQKFTYRRVTILTLQKSPDDDVMAVKISDKLTHYFELKEYSTSK